MPYYGYGGYRGGYGGYSRGNYGRSYSRRRSYRRTYPRSGTGQLDLIKTATAAYNGVQYLRSLVNVEKHALTGTITATPDSSTGSLQCINLIAQGDTESDRQGDSVMLKQVHCNMRLTINSAASNTVVRVILFLYKQPQGATPTITFVLNAGNHLAPYNHDNAGLYTVLYDKQFSLSISGTQEVCPQFTRKFYQLHETFDGTGANVADIQTNGLWMAVISDESTNVPNFACRYQVLFIDN